jgi:hypothetical protein
MPTSLAHLRPDPAPVQAALCSRWDAALETATSLEQRSASLAAGGRVPAVTHGALGEAHKEAGNRHKRKHASKLTTNVHDARAERLRRAPCVQFAEVVEEVVA